MPWHCLSVNVLLSNITFLIFAVFDDTYIIIPAVNANSRESELINVESWSRVNNIESTHQVLRDRLHGQKAQNNSAAATADAKRSPCLNYQNTWNNFHQSSVSRRARKDSNKLQRANSVCVENSARTWHGRRSASDGFSVCRHSQADLSLKRVVGFRNHHRLATTSGIHSTKSS